MEQGDRLDLAQRVHEAMDRVIAAWAADHPDLPVPAPEPSPPARHADPNQAPATTIQWAEVTRLQASALRQEANALRQEGVQSREQAALLRHTTHKLHAFLEPPADEPDAGRFTRVGPGIVLPTMRGRR